MLVKGPAPDSGVASVPISAPAAPSDGQFETRELPLVAPAGGATGLLGASSTQPLQDNAAAAAPAATDTSPAVAAGNFAVSFGAYGSQADADAVIAYLKKSQLPGFSEAATINGRQAWRVRVGPYADRAQAEAARLQAVKVRNDVKAEVVTLDARADTAVAATPAAAPTPTPGAASPAASSAAAAPATATVKTESLPPEPVAAAKPAPKPEPKPEPKPAPAKPEPKPEAATAVAAPAAPAASGVGFAVQLGAFGQASEANALRDKVRAAGFSAFVEQVRTDKGTLNRVRVGPVANRAEAENLKAQVASKVGVAGMVRPHP